MEKLNEEGDKDMETITFQGFDLTEKRIRTDNKHFGQEIRIVEKLTKFSREVIKADENNLKLGFTHYIVVGADNSRGCLGGVADCWASYVFHPEKGFILGSN